jgi:hypothetical protein
MNRVVSSGLWNWQCLISVPANLTLSVMRLV